MLILLSVDRSGPRLAEFHYDRCRYTLEVAIALSPRTVRSPHVGRAHARDFCRSHRKCGGRARIDFRPPVLPPPTHTMLTTSLALGLPILQAHAIHNPRLHPLASIGSCRPCQLGCRWPTKQIGRRWIRPLSRGSPQVTRKRGLDFDANSGKDVGQQVISLAVNIRPRDWYKRGELLHCFSGTKSGVPRPCIGPRSSHDNTGRDQPARLLAVWWDVLKTSQKLVRSSATLWL